MLIKKIMPIKLLFTVKTTKENLVFNYSAFDPKIQNCIKFKLKLRRLNYKYV